MAKQRGRYMEFSPSQMATFVSALSRCLPVVDARVALSMFWCGNSFGLQFYRTGMSSLRFMVWLISGFATCDCFEICGVFFGGLKVESMDSFLWVFLLLHHSSAAWDAHATPKQVGATAQRGWVGLSGRTVGWIKGKKQLNILECFNSNRFNSANTLFLTDVFLLPSVFCFVPEFSPLRPDCHPVLRVLFGQWQLFKVSPGGQAMASCNSRSFGSNTISTSTLSPHNI